MTERMKAAMVDAFGNPLEIEEVPIPTPRIAQDPEILDEDASQADPEDIRRTYDRNNGYGTLWSD
jgi:hypothetical protein